MNLYVHTDSIQQRVLNPCGLVPKTYYIRQFVKICDLATYIFHFFTAYEATFRLQHINLTENCLYQQTRNTFKFVLRSDSKCDEKERNFRWLWTNFGQLLHWETLQCMTDDYRVTNGHDYVVLKKCDTNEKQSWECAGDDKKYIHRHEKQTLRYMGYGEFYDYVTVSNAWPSVAQWRRYGTRKEVCSQGKLTSLRTDV